MRKRVQWKTEKPTRTQQHHKDQCDANSIMEKYRRTGQFNHRPIVPGQYGDFSNFGDFKTSLDRVMSAQDQFNNLPAIVRKRFQNDPSQLVEFVLDEANRPEAEKLGLVAPKQADPKTSTNDDKTTKKDEPKV